MFSRQSKDEVIVLVRCHHPAAVRRNLKGRLRVD
jgi:hypothetical protein